MNDEEKRAVRELLAAIDSNAYRTIVQDVAEKVRELVDPTPKIRFAAYQFNSSPTASWDVCVVAPGGHTRIATFPRKEDAEKLVGELEIAVRLRINESEGARRI